MNVSADVSYLNRVDGVDQSFFVPNGDEERGTIIL